MIQIKWVAYFFPLGERAMSPAQSEDSGLAADRGTTYATISLPRENAAAMGIVFLGKCIPTHKFIRKPQHFFSSFLNLCNKKIHLEKKNFRIVFFPT